MQAASNDIVGQDKFPVPTVAGAVSGCKKWYFVGGGVRADTLIGKAGISKEQLLSWNTGIPSVNWENGLLAEYFYCVGV